MAPGKKSLFDDEDEDAENDWAVDKSYAKDYEQRKRTEALQKGH